MKKRKIRNYLIHHKMQLRLTLKFVLLVLLASVMTGMIVWLALWPLLAGFVPHGLVQQIQTQLLVKLSLYSIPLLVVMIVLGIIITHSIAGPIYNIERKLEKLLQGEEVEYIRIRRGDECQELVAEINEFIWLFKLSKEAVEKK